MASLAAERVSRTEARETLRMVRAINTAAWGDREQVEAFMRSLEVAAGMVEPEQPRKRRSRAVKSIAAKMLARGGKVTRG